ncbi:MAG: PhnD/SsuA/transferrin family substrate-binding protein [Terriglobia bacterium]
MAFPILVGAVVYDPKVVVIWEIIKDFFRAEGCPMDTVFYSNYELQVGALLSGHIHIAWNSPLAWIDAQRRSGSTCRAIAMRDTDRDRVTHWIVRRQSGFRSLQDLRGGAVAMGAKDSPQATLLPLHRLAAEGLRPYQDVEVRRFDLMIGKHGDHVGGELEALRCLQHEKCDACAVLDLNWEAWQADGTVNPESLISLATTQPFDHCNFTVTNTFPAARESHWLEALFRMSYANPEHRKMMDMEGLKAWLPGRTTGYQALTEAVQQFHFFEDHDK